MNITVIHVRNWEVKNTLRGITNEESVELLKSWVVGQDWDEVLEGLDSQSKASAYQALVDRAIDACFPLITVRRKTTDLPWVNAKVRHLIWRRKAVYRKEWGNPPVENHEKEDRKE